MLHVRSPEEKARKPIGGAKCISYRNKMPAFQEAINFASPSRLAS